MPTVNHILETALYVADPEVSARFYEGLFGWRRMLEQERMVALAVGETNQVLLLFRIGGSVGGEETPGGFIPGHDGRGQLHVAFAVPSEEIEAWKARLAERGVEVESVNRPERGGTSLYFRDPDGHCVELASPGIWPNY